MNVPLMIGLATVFVFAIGFLIGNGLNGRTQIALDKSQAEVRRDLNDRLRQLSITTQLARVPAEDTRNAHYWERAI